MKNMSQPRLHRAMIAVTLPCSSSLLIADEPATALDVTIQVPVINQFQDLQEQLGLAYLFTTHDFSIIK